MMEHIDIVVPCYNEQEALPVFYEETSRVVSSLEGYSFRFLLVDDGSTDNTIVVMKDLAKEHADVKYISFSRNFGKEAAMYAGLFYAAGDYVLIMDADLQHPPAMIADMLEGVKEGYDCCAARRISRDGESRLRSLFSWLYYKVSNRMTDIELPQNAADFRIMSRKMVNAVLAMAEVERFSKGIFAWVGFETKWLPYENIERTLGKTKWSFWKLVKYAAGGITSFSVIPLRFIAGMGFCIFFAAAFYIAATLVQTLLFGIDVPGYVTILCAVLFLGGIIELSVGILGEYVACIYMETKKRPVFVLRQTNLDIYTADGTDVEKVRITGRNDEPDRERGTEWKQYYM